VVLGDDGEFLFELGERLVVEIQQIDVQRDVATGAGVGMSSAMPSRLATREIFLLGFGQVVLGEGALDVRDQRSTLAVEKHAPAKQSRVERILGG